MSLLILLKRNTLGRRHRKHSSWVENGYDMESALSQGASCILNCPILPSVLRHISKLNAQLSASSTLAETWKDERFNKRFILKCEQGEGEMWICIPWMQDLQ